MRAVDCLLPPVLKEQREFFFMMTSPSRGHFAHLLITVCSVWNEHDYFLSSFKGTHHAGLFAVPNQLVIKRPLEKNS